mmetsp:Transcript_75281/g.230315  ORF Transcript_75281/g.230315 Transcript_75281/m.230315 type:complete len:226 (-) Transcript_75281:244-921(-)
MPGGEHECFEGHGLGAPGVQLHPGLEHVLSGHDALECDIFERDAFEHDGNGTSWIRVERDFGELDVRPQLRGRGVLPVRGPGRVLGGAPAPRLRADRALRAAPAGRLLHQRDLLGGRPSREGLRALLLRAVPRHAHERLLPRRQHQRLRRLDLAASGLPVPRPRGPPRRVREGERCVELQGRLGGLPDGPVPARRRVRAQHRLRGLRRLAGQRAASEVAERGGRR